MNCILDYTAFERDRAVLVTSIPAFDQLILTQLFLYSAPLSTEYLPKGP